MKMLGDIIIGIQQKRQWHLKGVAHLIAIDNDIEFRLDNRNHGSNTKAGDSAVLWHHPYHLAILPGQANFFPGFTQSSVYQILILLFLFTARKTNLPGVVSQV